MAKKPFGCGKDKQRLLQRLLIVRIKYLGPIMYSDPLIPSLTEHMEIKSPVTISTPRCFASLQHLPL